MSKVKNAVIYSILIYEKAEISVTGEVTPVSFGKYF